MPNSQTPNSRAARARCATAANQRKLAEGWQRLNILISPAAAAALDRLVTEHGTKTAAIEAALTGATKMNGKKIMDTAQAAKRADTAYSPTHPTHIGFYADAVYDAMRLDDPSLPEIPRLTEIAGDDQFNWSAAQVREIIEEGLNAA